MVAAIIIGFFFILVGLKPIGKGLVLGTVFSTINFIIMGETLALRINKTRGKIFLLSFGSLLFRYMLLAVPLILAIKFKQYNIIAAICGIFMVHLAILTDPLWSLISSQFGKKV